MLKKKSFYIMMLIFGIVLIGISLFIKGEDFKTLSGILIGIGSGISAVGIINIIMKNMEQKNPDLLKQNEIELKDERNTVIRYRAKAKAGDITQWLIMGIAYISIIISAPLWVTLTIVGVFLLYTILGLCLMAKYEKEM